MKRLLVAVALALGLVITLAGNPMDSPASVTKDAQDQFVASNKLEPAPTAIDTGPSVSFVNPATTTAGGSYISANLNGEATIEAAAYYSDTGTRPFIENSAKNNSMAVITHSATARLPSQSDHPATAISVAEQPRLKSVPSAVLLV